MGYRLLSPGFLPLEVAFQVSQGSLSCRAALNRRLKGLSPGPSACRRCPLTGAPSQGVERHSWCWHESLHPVVTNWVIKGGLRYIYFVFFFLPLPPVRYFSPFPSSSSLSPTLRTLFSLRMFKVIIHLSLLIMHVTAPGRFSQSCLSWHMRFEQELCRSRFWSHRMGVSSGGW